MVNRVLSKELTKLVKQFPCVAILGPRQTGKTTLAKQLSKTLKKTTIYLDIELPSDRLKLADAETYFRFHSDKCIIIDEIQFMPELFNILRALIDEKRKAGRFIITGSASPALVRGVSESLAGRIAYTELTPIGLTEIPVTIKLQKHWMRGGFPDALLSSTEAKAQVWTNNFIKSYIERDLNQLFDINLSSNLVRNFWRMLAYNNSNLWNAETFARALNVTAPTVHKYLDYLEGAFLIRRLQPWQVNVNRRLVKAPKVYIRDSGLLHRLADITSMEALRGNTIIGASWEGYVIEQIAQALPESVTLFFYRTHDGAEMDLVLVQRNKVIQAIEIKTGNQTLPNKGFYESIKVLQPTKSFVISPAGEAYPIQKNILACSLQHYISKCLPK